MLVGLTPPQTLSESEGGAHTKHALAIGGPFGAILTYLCRKKRWGLTPRQRWGVGLLHPVKDEGGILHQVKDECGARPTVLTHPAMIMWG